MNKLISLKLNAIFSSSVILAGLLGLCVPLGMVAAHDGAEAIGADIADVPLFDAHMHYKREAWEPLPVASVLSIMDESGVAMALVSSTPDEGTIRLWEYAPQRIVPEARPYHAAANMLNWTKVPDMLGYIRQRMEKYPHVGIGEFHIHRLEPEDKPFLKQVAKLAREHNALIHIHSAAEPVKVMYELEPELTVIWAHAGMSEPPEVIGPMFARYKRLYVDTSYREYEILGADEGLDPQWRELIMKYPERFMLGSDTWVNRQWALYEELMETNRLWLSKLPRNVAEMIAYKNAEKLFGKSINMELIGKR